MEPSQANVVEHNGNCTLVIMAKAPRLGLVKTRLARSLPSLAVTSLYRCLLDDTMTLAQSLGNVEVAVMCPASDVDDLAWLARNGVRVVAQAGEGLASGLTSVFAHFAASGHHRIIAFNSDSPHLPASALECAFEALATHDLVVGPTHDGGYYLVGAKVAHAGLFNGDGMGKSNALEMLLARAKALRLSVDLADSFYDIDVASDLMRLATELRFAPSRAPRTAAWLAEWGQLVAQLPLGMGEL
jgi:rSAM/selenodomain-associated transferase 1